MTHSSFSLTYNVGGDAAAVVAESAGVCIRPVVRTVTDMLTGERTAVPIPCGSTREAVCPPCATRARRLRMHQCREGWHLTLDPKLKAGAVAPGPGAPELVADCGEVDRAGVAGRRVRSTRRLDGFPSLPTIPMEDRTTGRAFTDARTGRTFQPSMFVTLTLPSYGKVVDGIGVPRNPSTYDYRRAALDALLWPRLLDRFWQNLRRCAGFKVQYFSAIEAQRRLAPHVHAAIRGAIPRATIKAVVRATYHAAWWPPFAEVVFDGPRQPMWDATGGRYCDPDTGEPLVSWDNAVENLEAPAHVVRFGAQLDVKGLLGGTEDSDRTVRYLCKYLTKSVAETYADQHHSAKAVAEYARHIGRLHEEVRWLPCSASCANWLRFGVEPKDPGPGLAAGMCCSPAHDRENLGLGGRRVLVSRQWSGKTLTEHKADRREVVRQVLAAAGIEASEANRLAADQVLPDGSPRYVWTDTPAADVEYVAVIAASLRQARRWRQQYDSAKRAIGQCDSSPPGDSGSAIAVAHMVVA